MQGIRIPEGSSHSSRETENKWPERGQAFGSNPRRCLGKTTLEDKYEKFERAIYKIAQKSDESNESYMARHEIVFEDLVSQGATLTDVRAYVLLRNSVLTAGDKKHLIVEAKGDLKYEQVT